MLERLSLHPLLLHDQNIAIKANANVIAEKLYRRVIGLFVVIFIAEQFLFNFIFVAFMRVSDNQFSDETGEK